MNSILPTISGKLDPQLIEVLADVDACCRACSDGFDYAMANGRLLGRHMARIMDPRTRARVIDILKRESPPEPALRLAGQMRVANAALDTLAERIGHVLSGIQDVAPPQHGVVHGRDVA